MRKTTCLLSFILLSVLSHAQKFTISGYLKDAETGESLIGATILHAKSSSGSTANTHGFYSLTLPKDSVKLLYQYVGYQPATINFFLKRDTVVNINLHGATVLNEVIINSTKADAIHETTKMSTLTLPVEQIKALPAFMGETDILKVLQLMPGVQSGNEGSTGLYVRGGGPDQNLMLLDGVPIYNASHLFGFFSVFNADAINHVELIKGGFPARYGGRLSSVIDINMKEGSMKKMKGEGSIGIIAAKATVEGPIVKDRTSFIVSARRTYIDVLAQPIIHAQAHRQGSNANAGYYFYDLNLKLNHIVNPRNRLYFSTYFGNDKAYAKSTDTYQRDTVFTKTHSEFSLKWGNVITAARWNHVFGPKLFSNVTATYSRYLFDIAQKYQETNTMPTSPAQNSSSGIQYHSGIRDWAAKIDFDYLPSPYKSQGDEIQMKITFKDPVESKNYYEIKVLRNSYYIYKQDTTRFLEDIYVEPVDATLDNDLSNGTGKLLDDQFFNGKNYELRIRLRSHNFNTEDTERLRVVLMSVTEDYYRYFVTQSLQNNTQGDPFAQPVLIYSNVENGLGIFAGYSTSVVEVK